MFKAAEYVLECLKGTLMTLHKYIYIDENISMRIYRFEYIDVNISMRKSDQDSRPEYHSPECLSSTEYGWDFHRMTCLGTLMENIDAAQLSDLVREEFLVYMAFIAMQRAIWRASAP